jgi:multiple sugar transport system ATP-binding protein
MNFLKGRMKTGADASTVSLGDNGSSIELPLSGKIASASTADVVLGVRPEHIGRAVESCAPEGYVRIRSTVELVQPTGSRSYATCRLAGQTVLAELQAHDLGRVGEPINLDINLSRAVLFDSASGKALQR